MMAKASRQGNADVTGSSSPFDGARETPQRRHKSRPEAAAKDTEENALRFRLHVEADETGKHGNDGESWARWPLTPAGAR